MLGRLLVWGGRSIRTLFKSSGRVGFGTRLSKLFSVTKGSKASRLATIFKSNIRKGSRTASTISSRISSSKLGKAYAKLPSWVRTGVSTVGQAFFLDKAFDYLFGPTETEGAEPIGPDGNPIEGEDVMSKILEANGHSSLINAYQDTSRVNSQYQLPYEEAIVDIMSNTSLIFTGEYDGKYQTQIQVMTDMERFILISRAAMLIKAIAHGSEHASVFELSGIQCLASEMVNAAPTQGAEEFCDAPEGFKEIAADVADQHILLFNQLYDEVSEASAKDYFEANTAVFSDKLFIPAFNEDYATLVVSKLATDFSVGFSMSWWKKYLTDDDGGDDESQALRMISRHSSLSAAYYREMVNKS